MESRREETKAAKPRPEEKQKRFRIVKLEERIAPSKGGNGTNKECPSPTGLPGCPGFSGLSIE
jgi:hypothetical protein